MIILSFFKDIVSDMIIPRGLKPFYGRSEHFSPHTRPIHLLSHGRCRPLRGILWKTTS